MAEYIEREAAFNAILKLIPKVDDDGYCWVIRGDAAKAVDSIPTVDVAPVRHGHWTICKSYNPAFKGFECSECGAQFQGYRPDNYCGNCGAKMDVNEDV